LLPLAFFLLYKLHSKEKSLRVIFYYIVYCVLNEGLSYYFQKIHFVSYFFIIFELFTVVEFSLFCLFYYYVLPPGLMKRFIFPIWILFATFTGIDFFFVNKMSDFDSINIGVESILIILLCIYYLMVQLKGTQNLFVYSTTNFWIIITFLFYLSGTFFLYIMAENMINDKAFRIQYDIINSVFNILKNILLSIALLMKSSPSKVELRKSNDWSDLHSYKLKK
jgi:hypothetical protein